jgi:DNA processing protein
MKSWRDWQIKQVEKSDKRYPKLLKQIKKPPERLFYRGEWSKDIFKNCLAVVGARKMTRYGEGVVEKLIPDLSQAGVTIVSGFMYGVDSQAHKVCIAAGGRTIAVFGCGLDQVTPVQNDRLYTEILENEGLVMSEYEAEMKARLWTFPQRNRIVAGLSKGVLVIEGGEKSGSLITAKSGLEQNKKVMAVPGPVDSSMAVGVNWLIKNGGVMVTTVEEILKELGLVGETVKREEIVGLSKLESQIVEELKRESLGVDELARRLNKDVVEVSQIVSLMSVKGLIKEYVGKYMLG